MDTAETITLSWSPGELSAQVSKLEKTLEPSAPAELVVPQRLGTVRLVRELGRGGMGLVWLGHHEFLDRPVAVKFLLRASVEREDPRYQAFLDGARAASNVRHLAMSSVLHADLVNGVPYIVMEYISGPTVGELVERCGPLRPAVVLAILDRIADAVGTLHDAGVVHRDIKPSNILVDSAGNSFLTDFGLAIRAGTESPFGACGTPMYMAPEVFAGQSSARTDVYALAVTAYHILVGRPPPTGTIAEMRSMHQSGVIDAEALRQAGISSALTEVLKRGAAPEPIHRTKSARKFLEGFREALGAPVGGGSGGAGGGLDQLAKLVEQVGSRADAPGALDATRVPGGASPASAGRGPSAPRRDLLIVPIPCDPCGYDLKGLSHDGECPECRSPIERSLSPDRLIFADRTWLTGVQRGTRRLGFSLLSCPVLVGLPFATESISANREAAWILACCITVAVSAPLIAAAYRAAAAPEPGGTRMHPYRPAPAFIAATLAAGAVALAAVAAVLDYRPGTVGRATVPVIIMEGLWLVLVCGLVPRLLACAVETLSRAPRRPTRRTASGLTHASTVLGVLVLIGFAIGIAAGLTRDGLADVSVGSPMLLGAVLFVPVAMVACFLVSREWGQVARIRVDRPGPPPARGDPTPGAGSSYYQTLRTFTERRRGSTPAPPLPQASAPGGPGDGSSSSPGAPPQPSQPDSRS